MSSSSRSRSRSSDCSNSSKLSRMHDFEQMVFTIKRDLKRMRDNIWEYDLMLKKGNSSNDFMQSRTRDLIESEARRLDSLKNILASRRDDRYDYKYDSKHDSKHDSKYESKYEMTSYQPKILKEERNFRSLTCPECGITVQSKGLWCHLKKSHNQQRFFKCYYCPFESTLASALAIHIRQHQEGPDKKRLDYRCPYTDIIFTSIPHLQTHITECRSYTVFHPPQNVKLSKAKLQSLQQKDMQEIKMEAQ